MQREAIRRRCRNLAALTFAVCFALCWAGVARAGYAVSPGSGSTTTANPTFEVVLDPSEVLTATVYVASDTQMGQYFIPASLLGSCSPITQTATAGHYSCAPTAYSNAGFGPSLPPGTYWWWLTYYHTDPGTFVSTLQISGPLTFTVPQPVAPANTYLISPADGASLAAPVTFKINAPAGATMKVYVGMSTDRQDDGSPLGLTIYSCGGMTTTAGPYDCTDGASNTDFIQGVTYYWWAVITVGGAGWVYGPRSFILISPSGGGTSGTSGGGNSGSGGSSSGSTHSLSDAPYLPGAARYTGRSIKQTRLSAATYKLSKYVRLPKTIAVACWSTADWPGVSGDDPLTDGGYSTLAFWTPLLPHWISLSPGTCRAIETLLHNRPRYPNRITANAVETVTHEMMHAVGVTRQRFGAQAEARAECYGMQLSVVLATHLGVPYSYAFRLAKFNLLNYQTRPPSYQDQYHCRENGAWDLFPNKPSPPWHSFGV